MFSLSTVDSVSVMEWALRYTPVVERVILDFDGEAFIMRIDRWTFGNGPRF
jgi:hypothetical protein